MMINTANNFSVVLAESINGAVTSVDVVDATGAPATDFMLTIGSEIIKVTNVSGNTLTIARGQEGTSGVPHTAGDVAENRFTAGTWASHVNSGAGENVHGLMFKGALLDITSALSILDDELTVLDWDRVSYDTNNFYNAANPSRLTVPAGVTKARVQCGLRWGSSTAGARFVSVRKNGGSFIGRPSSALDASSITNSQITISSAVVAVEAGDCFDVQVLQTSGGALDVSSDPRTWFAIEVVE